MSSFIQDSLYTPKTAVRPVGWPHEKPEEIFSAAQAHAVMQAHRECLRGQCARKQAAWRVLVEAGKIVPDVRTRS